MSDDIQDFCPGCGRLVAASLEHLAGGEWRCHTLSRPKPIDHPAPIGHPDHYTAGRKYEPLDVILDWQLGFCLGNVVKYISRAGRKGDALTDLRKAQVYLTRAIAELGGDRTTIIVPEAPRRRGA